MGSLGRRAAARRCASSASGFLPAQDAENLLPLRPKSAGRAGWLRLAGHQVVFSTSNFDRDDIVAGAIGFIATAGEMLNLHPHLHILMTDGYMIRSPLVLERLKWDTERGELTYQARPKPSKGLASQAEKQCTMRAGGGDEEALSVVDFLCGAPLLGE